MAGKISEDPVATDLVDAVLAIVQDDINKQAPSTLLMLLDANGAVAGLARFIGTVNQTAQGIDRVDIGVESGTPRMVFENAGGTIWLVDNSSNVFRWFTPGVVQMQLAEGSILTLNQSTAEINLGHVSDTTITRLAAGEVGVEGKRIVASASPPTKTADFTVAAGETTIVNNKSGSTCVATLPSAASFPGRILIFNNEQAQLLNSASSNVVPKAGGSAGTGILPASTGAWALLQSNGTNWKILMSGT